MVSADTNCLIAYFEGDRAADVEFLEKLLRRRVLVVSSVVVTELLSSPTLPKQAEQLFVAIPRLGLTDGYWERSGKLRARLASSGFKARLGDTLIAQSCIDHDTPLLTRDKGFRRFAEVAGLKLI